MIDLATRRPANKSAAMVIARNNEPVRAKVVKKTDTRITTRFNIPLKKISKLHENNVQFVNFTGVRYGKLTVLGLFRDSNRWVVRCDCGNQELRKNKSVKKGASDSKCRDCQDLKRTRSKLFFASHGFYRDELI